MIWKELIIQSGGLLCIWPCVVGCGSCALDLGAVAVVSFMRLAGLALSSVPCSAMGCRAIGRSVTFFSFFSFAMGFGAVGRFLYFIEPPVVLVAFSAWRQSSRSNVRIARYCVTVKFFTAAFIISLGKLDKRQISNILHFTHSSYNARCYVAYFVNGTQSGQIRNDLYISQSIVRRTWMRNEKVSDIARYAFA